MDDIAKEVMDQIKRREFAGAMTDLAESQKLIDSAMGAFDVDIVDERNVHFELEQAVKHLGRAISMLDILRRF